MNNLQWLYQTDDTFRESAQRAAADWLGSTSANFADAWLRERYHEEDEACLLGQHAEPEEMDSREKLEADVHRFFEDDYYHDYYTENDLVSVTTKWLDRQAAITRREWEYPLMKAGRDAVEIERSIAEKYRADAIAAQAERDAYRELCGKMRKMANDMLCMEVD